MPIYTFSTALEAMKNNSSLEAICYKMELIGTLTYSYMIEREEDTFWHSCEVIGAEYKEPILLWKKLILPAICCSANTNCCLPAPCSPLARQTATGYISPVAQVSLTIQLPPSCLNSPESGTLAPLPNPLSPLALSRQSSESVQEQVTGIEEKKVNTHLYFDEDGNEISKEELDSQFLLSISLSPGAQPTPFRHPRVLLFYLQYIAAAKELDTGSDIFHWPTLTESDRDYIYTFISHFPPPSEFHKEVRELFSLMDCCPY